MSRKWFTVVLTSLLIGIVLNVAVTWSLAWRAGQHGWQMQATRSSLRGAEVVWPVAPPADWPTMPGGLDRFENWAGRLDSYSSSKVTDRIVPPGTPVEIRVYQQNVWHWGIPMRSLKMTWQQAETNDVTGSGGYRQHVPEETAWASGVLLPKPLWRSRGPSVLPLMPIWPGFVVNTLFYGAIAGAILFAPGAVRRARRRRRGWCLACGYDVGGLAVCPECGAAARKMANGK